MMIRYLDTWGSRLQVLRLIGSTLSLLRGSWAFWWRVSALGARVWDLTTRVQEFRVESLGFRGLGFGV